MGENKDLVKFVFDKSADEILDFHVIVLHITDLADELIAVMESRCTIANPTSLKK